MSKLVVLPVLPFLSELLRIVSQIVIYNGLYVFFVLNYMIQGSGTDSDILCIKIAVNIIMK